MTRELWQRVNAFLRETKDVGHGPGGNVALFECRGCEDTYVGEDLQTCPACGQPVESIPNERDLGYI